MPIEGGVILTPEQVLAWIEKDKAEYDEYVKEGMFDPDTNELFDIPEWMDDGNPDNGPFDFALNPSQKHIGW